MGKGGNIGMALSSHIKMPNLGIKKRLTGRSGGKRKANRTKKARRSRKGGFTGAIEQAIVPFGLLAAQKRMQKRSKKGGRKSRKSRKSKTHKRRH